MIFVTAATEPTVFLMLSEQDVITMRQGRTVFLGDRATGGASFKKAVLSLHPTNEAAIETIRRAGHTVLGSQIVSHEPRPGDRRCDGCGGLLPEPSLFEGRCTVCWATEAKQARLERS